MTDHANPTRPDDRDDELDAALRSAFNASEPAGPEKDVPLKRQWDDDLEAELEKALEGFDPSSYEVATPRRDRSAERSHVVPGTRGQETRLGPQQGKVIAVRGKSVFVDLGAKSEGVVPVEQFQDSLPNPGELIDVMVDRFDPDEGLLLLSLKGAAVEANWETLRPGLIVEARPTKVNKGGLEVDVSGIRGFLPIGQIDLVRVEDPAVFLNQRLRVIVTEARPRQKNLVVSRRELLQREREEQREKTWAELEEGQVRTGVVRSIKDFGAFVDIGGVDGLLHVSDLSWTRTSDIHALIKLGDQVQVKVLRVDRDTRKVSLGLKQLQPSPWDRVEENYPRGATVPGRVTRLMDFGAFVELEPGVEGLIHVSELAPNRVRRVADIVQPGQEVEVRILSVDPDAQKISLSLRPGLGPAETPREDQAEAEGEGEEATPPPAKPKRTTPLKGGLGDRDPNPF